ncbi:hypothetical protein CC79DRAFT_1338482 [Sarocladium strictum]
MLFAPVADPIRRGRSWCPVSEPQRKQCPIKSDRWRPSSLSKGIKPSMIVAGIIDCSHESAVPLWSRAIKPSSMTPEYRQVAVSGFQLAVWTCAVFLGPSAWTIVPHNSGARPL